jgi:hypothetical protein
MAKSYGKIYQHKNNVSITPTDVYNLYPVGSIYLSVNSTNPSNYFGGTWEKLSGGYLYATGSNVLGKTSYIGWGAQSTTLTTEQIPSHTHIIQSGDGGNYQFMGYAPETNRIDGWDNYYIKYDGVTSNPKKYITNSYTGGNQGHTHNIATIDVWMWKRVA